MRLFLSRNEVTPGELRKILNEQESFDVWAGLWMNKGATFVVDQDIGFIMGELFTYYRRHVSKIIDHVKTGEFDLNAYMALCAHWSWHAWQSLFELPWR